MAADWFLPLDEVGLRCLTEANGVNVSYPLESSRGYYFVGLCFRGDGHQVQRTLRNASVVSAVRLWMNDPRMDEAQALRERS